MSKHNYFKNPVKVQKYFKGVPPGINFLKAVDKTRSAIQRQSYQGHFWTCG
jgi:hypothetical protein